MYESNQSLKSLLQGIIFIIHVSVVSNGFSQHMSHKIHPALADLMDVSKMTHQATISGNWSNSATWGGDVPGDNARVYIPPGITITIDGKLPSRFKHIRVDGKLRFATNVDTELKVETLATWPMSTLEVGTDENPIQKNVTARIVLIDNGLLDITEDYELLGRAVIPQGMVRFHGQEKTTWRQSSGWLPAGSNKITLRSAPKNWQAGDRVVLSGTFSEEQEVFTIAEINGATIIFEKPTQYNRTITSTHPVFKGQYPYLANYSRNVIIESENKGRDQENIPHRGHLMFMHTQNVIFKYVQLEELGRTDKSREFVRIDELTNNSDNSIARYALHFHRAGDMDLDATFGLVKGCALWGSPGWGYVNHESSVWFYDNASYDVFGSHFTDENGTELGGFINNIAIFSKGSVDYAGGFSEKRRTPGDHGHTGVGFWATSGATVRWEGNVATDHNMSGYAIISRRIPNDAHDYDLSVHDNQLIDNGEGIVNPKIVGMNFFRNNINHGGNSGLVIVDMELNGRLNTHNLFENFTVMNTKRSGLALEYTRNLHLKGIKLMRDDVMKTSKWNGSNGVSAVGTWDHFFRHQTKGWTYFENSTIYNYYNGFNLQRGDSAVEDQDSRVLILDNSEIIINNELADNMDYIKTDVKTSDIPSSPVFSDEGGTYGSEFSITISSDPDTEIYYSWANDYGWRLRDSVTYQLIISEDFRYNGEPITIQKGKRTAIYAMAVKNGITSRVKGAIYTIEDGAPPPVSRAVTDINIDTPGPLELKINDDLLLEYIISPSDVISPSVTWSSSDTSVVSVSPIGFVVGKKEGTATVFVTTNDGGFTDQITINVTSIPVTGLTVSPSFVDLLEGNNKTLSVNISPNNATNQSVTWSSDNESVATVDNDGKVTAISVGTTNIIATATDGGHTDKSVVTVTSSTNIAPDASFTFLLEGLSASFTNNSSDLNGDTLSYNWNFGDGNTSIEQSPSHTYATNGMYKVSLTVSDGFLGDIYSITIKISEPDTNSSLQASFTFSLEGLLASFMNMSSDPDSDTLSYSWDFGDGNTSIEQSPNHTYAASGTYTVSLTVSDGFLDNTYSESITVINPNNQLPEIDWINENEVVYAFKEEVILETTIIDRDGTIEKMQFFHKDTLLTEITGGAFKYVWEAPLSGYYEITVIAFDNDGGKAVSEPLSFTVLLSDGNLPPLSEEEEKILPLELSYGPNPIMQYLTIDFEGKEISEIDIVAIDLTGKRILLPKVGIESNLQIKLSLERLPKGLYFIEVILNNHKEYFKVVKQ